MPVVVVVVVVDDDDDDDQVVHYDGGFGDGCDGYAQTRLSREQQNNTCATQTKNKQTTTYYNKGNLALMIGRGINKKIRFQRILQKL